MVLATAKKVAMQALGRQHVGSGRWYVLGVPNPADPNKSIVAINLAPKLLSGSELDLVTTGFYEFAAWSQNGHRSGFGMFREKDIKSFVNGR